jgi:hypothetical protein
MSFNDNSNNKILFRKEDDDDEEMEDVDEQVVQDSVLAKASAIQVVEELPARILSSPYPQHQPPDSRYQNALQRIQADPQHDIEAWEAILTEVQVCYRQLHNIHAVDAETTAQLDWMMSCYGHLLQYFPYAVEHLLSVATLLFRCSALFGEDGGPTVRVVAGMTYRARQAQATLDRLLLNKLVPRDEEAEENAAVPPAALITGICNWYVPLWLLHLQNKQRSLARQFPNAPEEQRPRMHQAFQMALKYAGGHVNNHELWRRYLQWIQISTAPGHEQMLELRSAYQQLITHPMTGLDGLWQEYEAFEKAQNEVLAQALVQEWAPKYQHARSVYLERSRVYAYESLRWTRLAAPPDNEARQEECDLWNVWKTALAYERTNPERLNVTDLTTRLRGWWQAAVCVFTRHVEPWHMWSMWESTTSSLERQRSVLQLGQHYIPDAVLLAIAESQLVELQCSTSQQPSSENTQHQEECIQVMERNIQRAPTTLGFVVLQQLVRRYRGMEAARQVFARGRRVLRSQEDKDGSASNGKTDVALESNTTTSNKVVTNRWSAANSSHAVSPASGEHVISPGPVTWHLYAAHAAMEQHQNHAPEIAARVYELGLRKHSVFLQKPAYVLRYASLLLQLNDPVNLRALLTRAVAACSKDNNSTASSNSAATRALLDLQMYFEHFLVKSTEDVKRLHQMEAQRRQALFGPDVEDVGTGVIHTQTEKASISEQLVRQEGYDTASKIVNGLQRSVDLLSVSGWWGNQDVFGRWNLPEDEEDWSGGASDASYYERQRHQDQRHGGALAFDLKQQPQRGAAGATASTAAAAAGPASAMMVAIQTSPEWLRSLLLLLPASRLRLPIVAKPPPHLVEMALATLLNNDLPAERPADEAPTTTTTSNKRTVGTGDDSDDENGMEANGGGFGGQFRARQRQRVQEHIM